MPLTDILDFGTRAFNTLDVDLLEFALIHEVVDVARTDGGIERVVDHVVGHPERTGLVVVDIDLQHRGVGHTVMAHLLQTGIGVGGREELPHHLHEVVVPSAGAVLQVEVKAVGHTEFRHRRQREGKA